MKNPHARPEPVLFCSSQLALPLCNRCSAENACLQSYCTLCWWQDGHPVSVGRRMEQMLPLSTYFEYSDRHATVDTASAAEGSGGWLEKHFAEELVRLLHQASPWQRPRGKELPELLRLAGGLHTWTTPRQGEYGPWYRPLETTTGLMKAAGAAAASAKRALPLDLVAIGAAEAEGAAVQVCEVVDAAAAEADGMAPSAAMCRAGEDAEQLFSDSEVSDADEAEAAAARDAAESLARERAQTACEQCSGSLGAHPLRLSTCRHALCECCVLNTVVLFNECPICGTHVHRHGHSKTVGLPVGDEDSVTPQPYATDEDAERAQAAAQSTRRRAETALLLEYGNEAVATSGGKTAYKTFVRVLRRAGTGSADTIRRVTFNINPSYDRPTAIVDRPNDKVLGYTFDYAMGREYPCVVRVEFVERPPLTIEYFVRDCCKESSGECRQVAWRLAVPAPPTTKGKMLSKKGIVVDVAEKARSLWV